MKNKKDKNFYKTLLFLALPIMGQELINSFVNILDTFMIGSLGVHEIAAVGLANQVFFLFILLTFGVNSGAAILMGQFFGAKDTKSIRKTLGIAIAGSVLAAGLFSAAAFFAPKTIMSIYSKDARVIEIGVSYLRIIWVSYILSAVTMSFAIALKSVRQTKIPMFTTVIALICNAVLNYIFIFEFNWGVQGAALGTVIARLVELVSIISITYFMKLPAAASIKELCSADFAFVKRFALVSAPVILNEAIWALGTSIYNIAYKYCGTDAQGALQIANSVQNMFFVVGISIGSASGIMIANMLGAGEIERAVRASRKSLKLAVSAGAVMGGVLAAASPFIAGIFNVSQEVRTLAVRCMLVIAMVIFVKMFNFTSIVGILRSGGDTWFCFALDAVAVWCIGVPFAFLGALILGLPVYYVVLLVAIEELAKAPVCWIRLKKNDWAKKLV